MNWALPYFLSTVLKKKSRSIKSYVTINFTLISRDEIFCGFITHNEPKNAKRLPELTCRKYLFDLRCYFKAGK